MISVSELMSTITLSTYLLEAIAIAFVSRFLMGKKSLDMETALLAITITAAHIVLDLFAPEVGTASRQGTGFNIGHRQVQSGGTGGLQGALGMQRALRPVQSGGTGGLQGALGMQRTLRRKQNGGGFETITVLSQDQAPPPRAPPVFMEPIPLSVVQVATQPKQNFEERCEASFLPTSEDIADEATAPPQINTIERFMDDKMALNYYNSNRNTATGAEGIEVVENMDDKVALSYYGNDRNSSIHEAFVSDIKQHVVTQVEPFIDTDANSATYANFKSGLGPTAGEKGLVYGTITASETGPHGTRTGQSLYSDDLVTITSSAGQKLMLLDNNKFIRGVDKNSNGLNDKLFKLRFKLVGKSDEGALQPIRYGDSVSILFNNEHAQTIAINHDGDLNVLANKRDIVFELINRDRPNVKDIINTADSILIRRSVEGTTKQYLRINRDRLKVETTAKEAVATSFVIKPQKGCGPMWRHDSDTRGSHLFNSSQVRDLLVARTSRLTDQIAELQGSIGKSQEAQSTPKV
jgi:hypothetical protein